MSDDACYSGLIAVQQQGADGIPLQLVTPGVKQGGLLALSVLTVLPQGARCVLWSCKSGFLALHKNILITALTFSSLKFLLMCSQRCSASPCLNSWRQIQLLFYQTPSVWRWQPRGHLWLNLLQCHAMWQMLLVQTEWQSSWTQEKQLSAVAAVVPNVHCARTSRQKKGREAWSRSNGKPAQGACSAIKAGAYFCQDLCNNRKENICRQFAAWKNTLLLWRRARNCKITWCYIIFQIGSFEINLNLFCS